MHLVCIDKMVTKQQRKERLKRQISDLYYERTQFWRTEEDHAETDKEINEIAKVLKKEFKLKSWEY